MKPLKRGFLRGIEIMREFLIGKNTENSEAGAHITCEYKVLIRDEQDDLPCECYGIKVTLIETGETEEIINITMNASQNDAV